jgi:TRAP-type C4-dicarboxylate transport system permease small subunit
MPLQTFRRALASEWFDTYARLGYAAKGLSFGVIGFLMARVAIGDRSERADFAGAMEELSAQPLLAGLLVLMAIGMVGYATWRLIQGVFDLEEEGNDALGLAKRAVYVVIGLTYLFFAAYALGILAGWSTQEGEVQDWTATILGWPYGRWLIGAAGGAVMIGGVTELWFALSRRFQVELGRDDITGLERAGLMAAGCVGHAGRALIYGAAGFFVIRAAVDFDPDEARGIADTIRELAEQPYGPWLVAFGAGGFIAYGIYYFLVARHHHLPNEGIMRGRGGGRASGRGERRPNERKAER